MSAKNNLSGNLQKSIKNVRRKHSTKALIVFISLAFLIIKLVIYSKQLYLKYKYNPVTEFLNQSSIHNSHKDIKYILFWNSFFESNYWAMDAEVQGEKYLKDLNCPATNCIFSHNRNYLPSPANYDAIVFHVAQLFDFWVPPVTRNEEQIYIMADQESPINTFQNLEQYNNFFNMTFTYRLDSDILFPYANIKDIKNEEIVAPSLNPEWKEPEVVTDPEILNFLSTKSKMSAWFVSRCKSFSNRELLVQKLQQFISVDVYGKCENLSCPRANKDHCLDMLNSTYKFYFSFENSICTDYITEKVFLNMENYIVPILYNGVANMQHFLPPKSYINVNDFNSIEELVKYLKFLDENPQEYANYFWWKKYYKIDNNPYPNSYCNICVKINEWDSKSKRQQYLDVAKWYNYKTCENKKINF